MKIPAGLILESDTQRVRRGFASGRLIRLGPGAYVDAELFAAEPAHSRFIYVAAAKMARAPRTVFCGETALMLNGFPILGHPREVETVVRQAHHSGRERCTARAAPTEVHADRLRQLWLPVVRSHAHPHQPVNDAAAFPHAGIGAAAAEVMGTAPLVRSLAVADGLRRWGAPNGVSREDMADLVGRLTTQRRRDQAAMVWELSSPLAESPLESASRAVMLLGGFEIPELQATFHDEIGELRVDAYWRRLRLVGEIDGTAKYTDAAITDGRSSREVLRAEKVREQRLYKQGLRIIRWGAREIFNPQELHHLLRTHGVPHNLGRRVRSVRG